jgi:hypothetical protein
VQIDAVADGTLVLHMTTAFRIGAGSAPIAAILAAERP